MNFFRYFNYKTFFKQWRGVLIAAPIIAGLVIILRLAGWLQIWELMALDRFFQLRPAELPDKRIVIVGITESDLQKLKTWPFTDAVIAELLEKVKRQKPKAIGLDLYRDLPIEPGHQRLVKVFQTTPNLIGIKKISSDLDPFGINPSPILQKLGQVGANDLVVDTDGKIRRFLLYLEDRNKESVPTLSLQLALIYLKSKEVNPKSAEVNPEYLQLGKAVFVRLRKNDGGYVRTYDEGYQILGNFRNPQNSFQIVSMADVLANKSEPDLFRDRVVLIGSTAPNLKDLFRTSYDNGLFTPSRETSGVEIHANLTSQIISASLEGRTLIKVWPDYFEWLWILFWAGIGESITWQWRYADRVRKISLKRGSIVILALAILLGSSYVAFLWGWWIPVVPPLLAFTGSGIFIIAYIAHSAGVIRKIFGRYLSDAVVPTLLETPAGLAIGGERRKITVLVSDLRGFTALSERISSEEAVKLINIYLDSMIEIITYYEGSINDLMGDGIMVLFGVPHAKKDDAERAVACAIAMQLAMPDVNQRISDLGSSHQLEMGIGINTGMAVLGNIGSERYTKYTAIGCEVNLAFRIETYTKYGEVFISESTLNEVRAIANIDSQKEVMPKGIKDPITIYEVRSIGGKYNLFLPKQEEVFLVLAEAIPLQYSILDDKQVSDTTYKGSLVQLSAKQALIKVEAAAAIEALSGINNIKFNLLTPNESVEMSEDIYAKVLDKVADSGNFYIGFTFLPPQVKASFQAIYKSISGG